MLGGKVVYGWGEDTIYLSPAPMYHAAPLAFSLNVQRFGGTVVIMEHFDAAEAIALIERDQITHSQWVPTMFVRMLKLPDEVRLRARPVVATASRSTRRRRARSR